MEGDIPNDAEVKDLLTIRLGPRKETLEKRFLGFMETVATTNYWNEVDEIIKNIMTNKKYDIGYWKEVGYVPNGDSTRQKWLKTLKILNEYTDRHKSDDYRRIEFVDE